MPVTSKTASKLFLISSRLAFVRSYSPASFPLFQTFATLKTWGGTWGHCPSVSSVSLGFLARGDNVFEHLILTVGSVFDSS